MVIALSADKSNSTHKVINSISRTMHQQYAGSIKNKITLYMQTIENTPSSKLINETRRSTCIAKFFY